MKRWICILCLIVSVPVWAQLQHGDDAIRVVGTDAVNVRTEPRVSAETFVSKVPRGTVMKRLDKRDGWYQVLLADGRKVWLSGRYGEEITAHDWLEVSKEAVNVRGSSNTASRRVATVKRGELLELLYERSGWYQVALTDGKRGWVRADMVVRRPLSPPKVEPAPEKRPEPAVPEPPKVNHYKQAHILLAENRVEDAIVAFRKALEERPDDGLIHFELAKVLKQDGQNEDALVHFRQALASGKREEARFYIEELLHSRTDSAQKAGVADVVAETETGPAWDTFGMLLPGLAIGSGVFIFVLGLVFWRRRKKMSPAKPPYRRRKRDAGFESVLKYAVEKRPLLRAIEEAEHKRAELDAALQQRFATFEGEERSTRLPAGASSEVLLQKVEDLRQVILNQEERAQIYSDLIVLQNQKLAALDEEIAALKKLIQIDYRDGDKKSAPGKQATG